MAGGPQKKPRRGTLGKSPIEFVDISSDRKRSSSVESKKTMQPQSRRPPHPPSWQARSRSNHPVRTIHPVYLFEVKTPAESQYPWDYYKLIATIPTDEAFRPLAESECPLVKK
jgi:branched-chain amino acid transport system substrate-binding protein